MNVVDDCPQAVDPMCSTARCDDGVCGFEYKPFGELESQIRGDCETLYCDGIGNVIAVPDGSDTYNDGNQCTIDYCTVDDPKYSPPQVGDHLSRQAASRRVSSTLARILSNDFGVHLNG
jgi:hypothetical protein